jgi:hypothetical protein
MKIPNSITKVVGKAGLVLQKNSPKILLVAGIAGVITSAVLACRATLKLDATLKKSKTKIEMIKKKDITQEVRTKELVVAYTQIGADFMKLYGPSVGLGIIAVSCLVGSNQILTKRNVALMAAYKTVDEGFAAYRKRVEAEMSEDKAYATKHGLNTEEVVEKEVGEDGKTKKVKKTVYTNDPMDPNSLSPYARFYDETCTQWDKTPEYNLMYLRSQQNYFNDMLRSRGHVFLNEVYDALGITRSKAGAVVGWVISDTGDNFVDFGIFDGNTPKKRAFVNGDERSILLDFNVDGVIYSLI